MRKGLLRNAEYWLLFCGAFLSAPATSPAQKLDSPEQLLALTALRDYALHYTRSLPDFVCMQVIERTFGTNRRVHDSIEEQVSYVNGKENYAVIKINGQPAGKGQEQPPGILSTGEFGSLMAITLDPRTGADIRWERAATRDGRKVNVFAYRVPAQNGYGLVESTGTRRVPYRGLIYADVQTGAVVRIELQCQIPKESEYQDLEIALDYKPAEVAGREFLLPSHYSLHALREAGRANRNLPREQRRFIQENNETDYKSYRKFEADSSVTFGPDGGHTR